MSDMQVVPPFPLMWCKRLFIYSVAALHIERQTIDTSVNIVYAEAPPIEHPQDDPVFDRSVTMALRQIGRKLYPPSEGWTECAVTYACVERAIDELIGMRGGLAA